MNILETINLWFAMNENGPATDERQLLNDAAEEIERLTEELESARALVVDRWTNEHQSAIDQILQNHIDRVQSERDAALAELADSVSDETRILLEQERVDK